MRLSRTRRALGRKSGVRLPVAVRCFVEAMESRLLLSAGGGFTGAGITGSYYNNAALTGTPSFTRVDDRIDFNFGSTATPGGSTDPQYAAPGTSNWSARWVGQFIPKYSETYTFTVTSEGAARLYVAPCNQSFGSPLINDFTEHATQAVDINTYSLTAGQTYNIELDYETTSTPSEIKLHWSSNSTPDEAIEPAEAIGINVDGGDALFANMVNGATRSNWWVSGNANANAPTDSNFWPTTDAEIFLGEGDVTLDSGGTYLIQFKGTATLSQTYATVGGKFYAGGVGYTTLPDGVGYNSSTGLTTATFVITPGSYNGFVLNFTNTSREDNTSSPQHDGITNLFVMQPTTLGGSTDYKPGTLFTNASLTELSQYSTLRDMGLTDTNGTIVSDWADRTTPQDEVWNGWAISGGSNNVSAGTTGTYGTGVPWEVCVALANETGKDIYINIPSNASLAYIDNLADLFAYGSNGILPYTSPQANPVWAPLDSNLKVYIEFSNEIWNFGFTQAGTAGNGWIDQISQRAIYDYETGNQNDPLYPGGGANGYNDGAIIAPLYITSSNEAAWLATYNASPTYPGYGSPQYFSNTDSALPGYTIYQGWVALRLEQISMAFKSVFGEVSVNADSNSSRVRPVFEWQYGGSWAGELSEMQTLFGSLNRVGFYLYGGGGAWYSDDTDSGFTDTTFANGNFATPTETAYAQNPAGSGWTFTGAAGIAANGSSLTNPTAPTIGPPNNPTGNGQTAYLQPGAKFSQSVDFSGGWADITLLAAQTVADDYVHGLTISIDGTAIGQSEGGVLFSGTGTPDTWVWSRTAAFNVSAGYHTVTFTSTLTTGTVFIDNLGIQTVTSLFNQTTAGGAPAITSVGSDVKLCQQYGLQDVGYEGGFDFNENLDGGDVNGYSEMGDRGYSSATPNVGLEANLDPRTVALAEATIDQFYYDGGTLPIVFEGSGNINSWAVDAPDYFNTSTPKQQGVDAIEQALPAAATFASTTVPATLLPQYKSEDDDDGNGTLQSSGWIAWEINVPVTGTYTFTAITTTGGNYRLSINDISSLGTGTSGGTIDPTMTLTPGLYTFKVEDTSGTFTVSQVVVTQAGAPPSPVISSATLTANGSTASATVSWNSSTGATGYILADGNSAGQYTTFIDEGNSLTATVTGLNATLPYDFAVYAYNASQERSLPSANVRLAPRSSDPSVYVNFQDDNVSDIVNDPVTEPLVAGTIQFTSFGNSAGKGLAIVDSGNGYYAVPTKGLDATSWGTSMQISPTVPGHAFDLYSMDLVSFQAWSAVITATDLGGGTLTQIVTFGNPGGGFYATSHQVLDWTDLVNVQITWWSAANGSGAARNGEIDNLVFNDVPPTITSAIATPAAVTGVSTNLSAVAADTKNPLSSLLYTWTATTVPAGAALPTFTDNNTNTAQSTTAYFRAAGNYVFTVTVTDASNLVATQTVAVTVSQTASGITVTPASPTVASGTSQQLTAVVGDQFGTPMGTQPSFSWSIGSGPGSVSSSGKFTAPASGSGSGWTYVSASGGGYTGTAAIYDTPTLAPNYYNNFSSGALTTVGNGAFNSSDGHIDLTTGGYEAGAAWYPTKLSTSSFVTDFAFQISTQTGYEPNGGMGGNGITFTIQNNGSSGAVVGTDNSGLGYQGINNSVALKFDLIPWDADWTSDVGSGNEEIDSIGVYTDGAAPTTPATDLSSTNVQLRSGDVFEAELTYNGSNLSVTLIDETDIHHWSVSETYAINIQSIVGAGTAWFGFTGGSYGSVPAGGYQDILWWTYGLPQVSISPENPIQTTGLTSITLNSNRPITSFNLSDLTLVRDGQAIPLGNTPVISTTNGGLTYTLSNLAGLTSNLGEYTLTATASGLTDTGGNGPGSNLSTSWTLETLIDNVSGDSITIAGAADSTASVTVGAAPAYTVNLLNLPQIFVDGLGGNDTLTLNFIAASAVPSGGMTYTGGTSIGDSLVITGTGDTDTAIIGGSQITFDSQAINLSDVQSVTINTGGGTDTLIQTSTPNEAVTFNSGTGSDQLNISGGTLLGGSGNLQVIMNGTAGAGNDQLNISAGTNTFTADPLPATGSLFVAAAGAATQLWFNPTSTRQIHLGGLTLSSGAVATVVSLGALHVPGNQRVLVIGSAGATSSPPFSIDPSSTLNLEDNDLVVHAGNLANIFTLLASGYNAPANGYWNGTGIVSSNAAAGSLTALGVGQPASAGTFDGETVGTTDVLVKYTYYGDATLDGKIDGSDYSRMDNSYLNHLTGWANGDFNYDGIINGSDYTLIDNAYNTQGASLAAEIASVTGTIIAPSAPANAAVDDPASAPAGVNLIAKPASLLSALDAAVTSGKSQTGNKTGAPATTQPYRWSSDLLLSVWPRSSPATSGTNAHDLFAFDPNAIGCQSPFSKRLISG